MNPVTLSQIDDLLIITYITYYAYICMFYKYNLWSISCELCELFCSPNETELTILF